MPMARSVADPLAAWLHDQLGIRLKARTPVGGGCIHSAWCLEASDGTRLFAKTNKAHQLPLLEAEAEGLEALAAVAPSGLRVPTPLARGLADGQAVLVLPWLELGRTTACPPGSWAAFGADLARLHRGSLPSDLQASSPSGSFGWDRDNFIGTSPQRNGWRESWSTFFAECRLKPQLDWLTRRGLAIEGAERLLALLPTLLEGHSPEPCLVHGDLWSGNGALVAGGGASVFDPAIYQADRETDLAMARLFGGFPETFFQGYNEEWPLAEGWQRREPIYQLYHLLNHANLFGGAYTGSAQTVIRSLLG